MHGLSHCRHRKKSLADDDRSFDRGHACCTPCPKLSTRLRPIISVIRSLACLPIWGVGRPPKLLHMGSRLSEALMIESTSFTQLQDLSATFVRLVESAAAGIVAIQSDHARSSGFFWRPGLVVTADEA